MGNQILINLKDSNENITRELIRQMKLDFIWLGVLARIGTDVNKFSE
jgi:hypothetical protein